MPELPEVETVRRGLAGRVVGRTIEHVAVGRERSVRRTSAQQVIDGLTGARILQADRRGKYLLLPLDTGDTLMVHLRMSGQLLLAPAGTDRPRAPPRRAERGDGPARPADGIVTINAKQHATSYTTPWDAICSSRRSCARHTSQASPDT